MESAGYIIELEVYEGEHCPAHKRGEKYRFPEDVGRLCPWLLDSINGMIRVLLFGGSLPWKYSGTPYEKELGDNLTTEFVRCPDPTKAGIVLKITKRKIETNKEN